LDVLKSADPVADQVVFREVYGCQKKPSTLRKLQSDTNLNLLKHNLPLRIERPGARILQLSLTPSG